MNVKRDAGTPGAQVSQLTDLATLSAHKLVRTLTTSSFCTEAMACVFPLRMYHALSQLWKMQAGFLEVQLFLRFIPSCSEHSSFQQIFWRSTGSMSL